MSDFTTVPVKIGPTIALHNGYEMPRLGFGCAFGNWTDRSDPQKVFFGFTPEVAYTCVPAALDAGYKLLDCALLYGTHKIVGHCLGNAIMSPNSSIRSRNDVFIVSKVFHGPSPVSLNTQQKSVDIAAFLADPSLDLSARIVHDYEKCLDELNVGYLDLLLVHWPGLWGSADLEGNARLRKAVWTAFEDLYLQGRVKAIGVSNFLVRHLEELESFCRVRPMVNQIEVSPYIQQKELVSYCKSKNIVVQAWGPFGSGATGVLSDEVVKSISEKHGRNAGQVILRWLLQLGLTALPKSASPDRMKANLNVFDFELDDEDINRINSLDRGISSVGTADSIA